MNERIRQLAEQAWEYACDLNHGEKSMSAIYDEKFAELIVREFFTLNKEVSEKLKEDDQGLPGYKTLMNLYEVSLHNHIQEHFGIEE